MHEYKVCFISEQPKVNTELCRSHSQGAVREPSQIMSLTAQIRVLEGFDVKRREREACVAMYANVHSGVMLLGRAWNAGSNNECLHRRLPLSSHKSCCNCSSRDKPVSDRDTERQQMQRLPRTCPPHNTASDHTLVKRRPIKLRFQLSRIGRLPLEQRLPPSPPLRSSSPPPPPTQRAPTTSLACPVTHSSSQLCTTLFHIIPHAPSVAHH